MPFYNTLDPSSSEDRRTAEGLLRLKAALSKTIPTKTLDDTLLVATWNIREFGGINKAGTKREREPLFYLAEVISRFDLVAVQEVRDDLGDLDALMQILGRSWRYLVTDETYGVQGNGERVAFVYDERKLSFGGLAGEIASEQVKGADGILTGKFAFARSPYIVGFRAGWFKFTICSSHLMYGDAVAEQPQRIKEMEELVRLLKKRINAKDRWAKNSILLGDFNIFKAAKADADSTFKAFSAVFKKPELLEGDLDKSNAERTKPYDQIGFLSPDLDAGNQMKTAKAGVFDFFQEVYRLTKEDEANYEPLWSASKLTYKQWRTFKMSDHLPKWVEVRIDFGDDYLMKKTKPAAARPDVRAFTTTPPVPAKKKTAKKAAAKKAAKKTET
jgi:endonuclease/exonuclease/phosphatase family metal-dependent hydrolase